MLDLAISLPGRGMVKLMILRNVLLIHDHLKSLKYVAHSRGKQTHSTLHYFVLVFHIYRKFIP